MATKQESRDVRSRGDGRKPLVIVPKQDADEIERRRRIREARHDQLATTIGPSRRPPH
jgi:hypothetical protein